MAKEVRFEVLPEMTGTISKKHSHLSLRRGVSGTVHTYCCPPNHCSERSELQRQHSATFAQRMKMAKAIMGDPEQRAEWEQRFDIAKAHRKTHYIRLQQFIAFNIEIEG